MGICVCVFQRISRLDYFKVVKNSLTLTVPNSEISEIRGFPSVPAVKFITLFSFATQILSQVILLTVPKILFMLRCSKNRITYYLRFRPHNWSVHLWTWQILENSFKTVLNQLLEILLILWN